MFGSFTDRLIQFSIRLGLFSFILLGLYGLGFVINKFLDFSWMTVIFTIIRTVVHVFDFAFDTNTLFTLLGYALLFQVAVWTFSAYMVIAKFFKD